MKHEKKNEGMKKGKSGGMKGNGGFSAGPAKQLKTIASKKG